MIHTMLTSLAAATLLSMATGSAAFGQDGTVDGGDYQVWHKGRLSTGKSAATNGAGKSAPGVSRQLKSKQRAVPCDCTNCSAQHCQPTYHKFQLQDALISSWSFGSSKKRRLQAK